MIINESYEKALCAIGLAKNEIKVYLELIILGSVPAGEIIKRTGLHRAAVYDLLDILIEKGLVSKIVKSNKTYFEAQNPSCLIEYLGSKRESFAQQEETLKKIIPSLETIRKINFSENKGAVYEGKNGLKVIFEDILKEKKLWSVWGATGRFKQLFPIYFTQFHKRREQSKIHLNIIYQDSLRSENRGDELKYRTIRYLSKEHITPSTIYLYGNRVAIILWTPEPLAFMISSEQVSESYHTFFKLLWEQAKR